MTPHFLINADDVLRLLRYALMSTVALAAVVAAAICWVIRQLLVLEFQGRHHERPVSETPPSPSNPPSKGFVSV